MFKKPHICGKTKVFIPTICSDSAYFVGTVDTTIPQGSDFDLTDGVKAYDADGMELPFTTTPLSIDTCTVGTHSVVYTAEGVSDTRTITVVATGNPTILGLTPIINVNIGDVVNTMQDVSAKDVNGNTIPVVCTEGTSVTYSEPGTFTLHYTATDKCGKVATGTRTVTVERESGSIVCTDKVCEMVVSCDTPPTPTQRYTVTLHAGTGGTVNGGGTFDSGTQITVTATPNANYSFEKWAKSSGGTAVSTSTSYTFTVTEDVDLYASFTYHEPTPTTYTVTPHAGAGGSVSGGGTYSSGAYTTVTATPNTNYTFSSWRKGNSTGEIVSTSASYTFAVTETVDLYASFIYHDPSLVTEELDITCPKGDRTTATISGTPDSGSTITLHYTLGSETGTVTFTYGTSSTKSVGDYEISYNGNKTFEVDGLSATGNTLVLNYLTYSETYYTVRTYAVTDGVLGDESGGETSGDGTFRAGTSVTVRASTSSGYEFTNWATRSSGTPSVSTSSTYTFTINSDIDLYAMFDEEEVAPTTYTVAVYSLGNGSVSGGGTYEEGETATITATPDSGYHFLRWNIGHPDSQQTSSSPTETFTVNSNWNWYARFEADTPTPSSRTETINTRCSPGDTASFSLSTTPASGTTISLSITYGGSTTETFTAGSSSSTSFGDYTISYNGSTGFTIDGTGVDEEAPNLKVVSATYYA